MNRIVIEGILRKNTRGRCHLVFRRRDGAVGVVRLTEAPDCPSGSTIAVTGLWKGNQLIVQKSLVRRFPRRAAAA